MPVGRGTLDGQAALRFLSYREERFRLVRRLGRGSTAVGLLVHDLLVDGPDAERVLKVALDDGGAARLDDEAEVLRRLDSPRVVKLLEDRPLIVGGRRALLMESAGPQTLTDILRTRPRLSLDLLERFGTDLLDGLVAIDKAGIDHRDLKPSNLGVREGRSDRVKHLVLFEMATGDTPVYGDGQADPATITDQARIEPGLFDPALAGCGCPKLARRR